MFEVLLDRGDREDASGQLAAADALAKLAARELP
jgi:hypothetical protein